MRQAFKVLSLIVFALCMVGILLGIFGWMLTTDAREQASAQTLAGASVGVMMLAATVWLLADIATSVGAGKIAEPSSATVDRGYDSKGISLALPPDAR